MTITSAFTGKKQTKSASSRRFLATKKPGRHTQEYPTRRGPPTVIHAVGGSIRELFMNLIFNRPATPDEYQNDEPENNCGGEGMPHLVNDHLSYCAGNEQRCKGCGVVCLRNASAGSALPGLRGF
jgi:hypothetical protein